MNQYQQHCNVLEVPTTATQAEIEKAFRLLVKVWHPDRFQHDANLREAAAEKLQRINEAYEYLLKNPQNKESQAGSYTDGECRYRGGDDRLRSLSFAIKGKPAIVNVNEEGVTVVTVEGNAPDEAVTYRSESIRLLKDSDGWWLTDGINLNQDFSGTRPLVPSDEILLRATDPEGLVSKIETRLSFRNSYYRKLFTKKCVQQFGLEKWKPPPQPESDATPHEHEHNEYEFSPTITCLVFAILAVLAFVITMSS